jgi:hypothetical protein
VVDEQGLQILQLERWARVASADLRGWLRQAQPERVVDEQWLRYFSLNGGRECFGLIWGLASTGSARTVVDEQSFDTLTPERFWGSARFCFFPFALSLSKGWGEGARLRQAQPERWWMNKASTPSPPSDFGVLPASVFFRSP